MLGLAQGEAVKELRICLAAHLMFQAWQGEMTLRGLSLHRILSRTFRGSRRFRQSMCSYRE